MFPIRDHSKSDKFPLVSVIFIIINVVFFLVELVQPDLEFFLTKFALIPGKVDWFVPVTLIPFLTSMFLHGGWLHLISNMWFLWIFGDNIEATLGSLNFAIFYLLTGFAAAVAQYFIDPGSLIPILGASGAIAGVLGSYLVLFPHSRIETFITGFGGYFRMVNVPAGFMLVYWLVTQFFSGVGSLASGAYSQGGVAFFAHLGGFGCGWILTKMLKPNLTIDA